MGNKYKIKGPRSRAPPGMNGAKAKAAAPSHAGLYVMTDVLFCLAAACASARGVWESDIWWQIRLGDEVWDGGGFPDHEEWTYTSGDKEFHNHWWLSSMFLSAVFNTGGLRGLILTRATVCGLFAHLLLNLSPRGTFRRYPLAGAVLFATRRRYNQLRPELFSVCIFAFMFLVRRRATNPLHYRSAILGCVVFSANCHVGVVPWACLLGAVLCAGDELFVKYWLPTINPKALAIGSLYGVAMFLNPQPQASLRYIMYHSPTVYHDHVLFNPEHQTWMAEVYSIGGAEIPETEQYVLMAYAVAAVVTPVVWLMTPRPLRPPGLQCPVCTLGLHSIFTLLAYDRTRNIPYSAILMGAMLTNGIAFAGTQLLPSWVHQIPGRKWAVAFYAITTIYCAILRGNVRRIIPEFTMHTYSWPTGCVDFIAEHLPVANIYHSFTFGGYMAYWLPRQYKLYGDTREYCFGHLSSVYKESYDNPEVLEATLAGYQVSTAIFKMSTEFFEMFDGSYRDISLEMLGPDWARVHFDHVAEVMLLRTPENAGLIEKFEYKYLDPSFPPRYFSDIVKQGGNHQIPDPARLLVEINRCLVTEPVQLYCKIVEFLLLLPEISKEVALEWLKFFEEPGINDEILRKKERVLTRSYAKSIRMLLYDELGLPQRPTERSFDETLSSAWDMWEQAKTVRAVVQGSASLYDTRPITDRKRVEVVEDGLVRSPRQSYYHLTRTVSYTCMAGWLTKGNDVESGDPVDVADWAAAEARCESWPQCAGFTIEHSNPRKAFFKTKDMFHPAPGWISCIKPTPTQAQMESQTNAVIEKRQEGAADLKRDGEL
jgi:hypothetical protein